MTEQLLTLREAADRLSVSKRTVQRLVWAGELPPIRISSRLLFAGDDLDDLISRFRAAERRGTPCRGSRGRAAPGGAGRSGASFAPAGAPPQEEAG